MNLLYFLKLPLFLKKLLHQLFALLFENAANNFGFGVKNFVVQFRNVSFYVGRAIDDFA